MLPSPTRASVHTVVRDLKEVVRVVATHKHAAMELGQTAEVEAVAPGTKKRKYIYSAVMRKK